MGCMRLSKLSLINIGRCLPDLTSLCFNAHGFPAVGNDITLDDALLALAEGCEKLTHLEVPTGVISHDAVGYLSGFCSNLKSLTLGQSRGLTDESLANLGDGCPNLERLVSSPLPFVSVDWRHTSDLYLVSLLFSFSFSLSLLNAVGITDNGIKRLLSKTKVLTHLAISYSHGISDTTAAAIGNCLGQTLRTLTLSNCSRISATGLTHLVSECTRLQVLDVSHCAALPADTLIRIRRSLPGCVVKYEH